MKMILLLLMLPMAALSQDKPVVKSYSDSTGKYLISYMCNFKYATTPAVEGAQPHYDAFIQVYKLIPLRCCKPQNDTVAIGKPFPGTYVPNGCFEDEPAEWVKKAKAQPKKD